MINKALTLSALVCAGLPLSAHAEESASDASAKDDKGGVYSLLVENDSLSSGADRNYTSGIKLAYVSPHHGVPDFLDRTLGPATRAITDAEPSFWGVAVGQSIFTPNDIEANPAPPDQHPYAGWLYMQLMVAAEQKVPAGVRPGFLDTYELEFGLVGPSALGEQAQRGIHQVLGAPKPQGWDSQLHDEFAFDASFDRRWHLSNARVTLNALGGLEADLTPSAGATIGTLRDEARAGLTARIGRGIDYDYGPPRVRPSLAGVEHFDGGHLSWSIFAGLQARAVAHDLFLDGNTFQDSASVDRKPLVADLQIGFDIAAGDWRIAYTYVTRTEEFTTQGEQQDFGALALSWRH